MRMRVRVYACHTTNHRSLLKNTPRNATCKATEDVVCLTLDRANFNAILGPLEALKKVCVDYIYVCVCVCVHVASLHLRTVFSLLC